MQALVGRMDKTEGRTETHHVEVGVALREQTALQTGMDASHDGSLAEQFLVGLGHNLGELAPRTHLPGRIAVA